MLPFKKGKPVSDLSAPILGSGWQTQQAWPDKKRSGE
jgi:hypothetical protein